MNQSPEVGMKLELVWRNPQALQHEERKIEATEYDREGAVYQVKSEGEVREFDLYEHVGDPSYVGRFERFERWYEHTIDLPGAWYLQVIRKLFKENQLAKGLFIALGKRLDLKYIVCPVYLLAGDHDDITPKEQVFAAEALLGTKSADIRKDLAKGGHIGLFMGRKVLRENWVRIAEWLSSAR